MKAVKAPKLMNDVAVARSRKTAKIVLLGLFHKESVFGSARGVAGG